MVPKSIVQSRFTSHYPLEIKRKQLRLARVRSSTLIAAVTAILLLAFVFLAAQTPQPSQMLEASPTPAESPSPSPSPTPEPSPTPLPAPLNFHRWGSITLFNGLPSDSVRAIAQTPDGVMWFGTENGLARFDGRRIQKYSLGSVGADRILVLRVGSSGTLWVGTAAGAFEYGEDGYRQVASTEDVSVTSLLIGDEVILGTSTGRILRAVPTPSGTMESSAMVADPITDGDGKPLAITAMARHGGKLIASTSGLGVFSIEDGSASEYQTSPRPLFVNSISIAPLGGLTIGADAAAGQSGVYKVGDGWVKRLVADTANVLALSSIDDDLWVGTEKNGLFRFSENDDVENFTFANTSGGLRSDFIFTLFTDREGVLWIGTNRGVSRFDRLGPLQETISESPNGNFIRTLFRSSNGRLYAGSNRGLWVKGSEMWTSVAGHERSTVFALAEERSGRLVVGTAGNKRDTRSFAEFRNDRYSAVHGLGLVRISVLDNVVVHAAASVNTLAATPEKLWIGTTESSLLSYDGKAVKAESELNAGAIWKIFPAPGNTLWIAAEKGVFRTADGQTEKIIDAEDVRDVYVNGPDVWAATTSRGLVHARKEDRFGWIVSSLGFEQGLPSEKTFAILSDDSGLLIASNRGFVTYRPGTIAPKLIATRVLSQRVHDTKELRSNIELDYPQNSLVVEVAGQSSRTSPQEFQYGFLLKDSRGEIVDTRISYDPQFAPAELKAGTYTIEVTAFDRDLLASDPLTISFSIARAPFPWTATALGVLLAIALIALAWAIVERRRIAQRNRELKQARFDLANEAERERGRIARDLHDQTLADLRNLMLKSDKIGIADPTFREDIESVSKEVRRICEDLSPSVLENVGLIAALEFLLSHTVDNYRFDSSQASDDAISFPTSVQLQIYRIAQEVLSNLQKHSDASLIEMSVTTSETGSFELIIADDGKPFSPSTDAKLDGRGIGGIRSRASLINAQVEWLQETVGNKFHLTL